MTQVYLHPDIDDYFVDYDFEAVRASPTDGGPSDLRRRLMQDYVGEGLILLRNVRIDYDQEFVSRLAFPQTWDFKKFSSKLVESPRPFDENPAKQALCRDIFSGDRGLYGKFEDEVRALNAGVRAVLDEILRAYAVTARDITWRHTETRVENLHFDIDRDAADFESVRLYLNTDDSPRIWHTSYGLSRILQRYYRELELEKMADQPVEELLRLLSLRLFGNWSSRGREQFPRHMALFEPGDIWISDGRTVPHQVIYGRRVISTFYRLDSAALPSWHPSLKSRLQQVHAAFRDNPPPAQGADMRGYVHPFPAGGPPPPTGHKALRKADWTTLHQDSLQDRIVRL